MSKTTSFQIDSQANNHNYKTAEFTSEYHILSLSGGKDSTALAFFMKENMPEIFEKTELVFCDTELELPETYDYLNKIEIFLDKKITWLRPEKSFDHLYDIRKFLPSIKNRWCTVELKIRVYRKFLKEHFKNASRINTYIGIRADELGRGLDETASIDKVVNIFPFQDYGITRDDVFKILNDVGIGLPKYYEWRKRSGCYFCFYQSPNDWLNLYEHYPELFYKAMEYEKFNNDGSKTYGWNMSYPLKDMILPENIKKIRENFAKNGKKKQVKNNLLITTI